MAETRPIEPSCGTFPAGAFGDRATRAATTTSESGPPEGHS
jgi:hypothetical protein